MSVSVTLLQTTGLSTVASGRNCTQIVPHERALKLRDHVRRGQWHHTEPVPDAVHGTGSAEPPGGLVLPQLQGAPTGHQGTVSLAPARGAHYPAETLLLHALHLPGQDRQDG